MTASPAKKSSKKSAAREVEVQAPPIGGAGPLSRQAPTFRNRVIDKKALRNLVSWAFFDKTDIWQSLA